MNLLYYNGASQESPHNAFPFLQEFQSKLPGWEIFTLFSIDNLVDTLKKPRISCENIMSLHIHMEGGVKILIEIDEVLSRDE